MEDEIGNKGHQKKPLLLLFPTYAANTWMGQCMVYFWVLISVAHALQKPTETKAHQRIWPFLEKESLGQLELLSFTELNHGESSVRNLMVGVLGDNLIMTTVESSILEIMLPLVLKWTYYKENTVWKLEWNLSF